MKKLKVIKNKNSKYKKLLKIIKIKRNILKVFLNINK